MTRSGHPSPKGDSEQAPERSPTRQGSFGYYVLGAMLGSILLAVPFSTVTFFIGGGISSPPGSATAALGGAAAGLIGGPVVAAIGSIFGKFAEVAIKETELRNVGRAVAVGGGAVLPHLLWLVPYPSVQGAAFVAVLWSLFGVSAVGRWRGGFARAIHS